MTWLARVVRWLVLCLVTILGAVALTGSAGSAATTPPFAPGTTTAGAATYAYDVLVMARVDAHTVDAAEASPSEPGAARSAFATTTAESRGRSMTPSVRSNATNTADDIVGLADDYIDITAKGSRVRNVQTSVGRSDFEQNLIDAGYQPTAAASGPNVVTYELNGARYVVRDAARSTGGPTADFYPAGSDGFTLKIRLAG